MPLKVQGFLRYARRERESFKHNGVALQGEAACWTAK